MKRAPWDSIFGREEHVWLEPDPWVVSFLAGVPAGSRLLDVGCGCGRHLRSASQKGILAVGLDESAVALQLAVDSLRGMACNADLAQGDFSSLPFLSGSFDAVLSTYCANHGTREQVRGYFSEMARVLRPGGKMAVILSAAGDYREGIGDRLEQHTYVLTDGPEEGVPHHYATETFVSECFDFASHTTLVLHTMDFPAIERCYGSPVHLRDHPAVQLKHHPVAANWRILGRK